MQRIRGRGLGFLLAALVLLPAAQPESAHWQIAPDRARRILRDAPFEVRAVEAAPSGTTGAYKLGLYFPQEKLTLRAKWKAVPDGGDGLNNSPRKEIAADALQRLVFSERDYVAPPAVLRCVERKALPEAVRPRKSNVEGATCVLGTLSLWIENVTVPDQLWSPERFKTDPVYARAMADLNLFAFLVNHRDGRSGNVLVASPPHPFWAYAVDNGISFDPRIANIFVMNWDSLRVPALRKDSIERLRALSPQQIDALGVLAEMRMDEDGTLRQVAPGANLGRKEGARIEPGVVQLGLTKRELKKLRKRIREVLKKVDAGEIGTF